MPRRSGRTAGRDPEAGAAQVTHDGRPGPPHRGVYGDPDRLVDHHDVVVVVDDPDALDHLGHDLERVVLAREGDVEHGPGTSRSDLAAAWPSTCTSSRESSSAALLREMPNMRASPTSTRSPPSPSGTCRVRCSPSDSAHRLVPASVVLVPCAVEADAAQQEHHAGSPPATSMQMSATLKTGQLRQREEVDDVAAEGPGSPEHPVDEVARHPGQQEAERHRPAPVSHPAGRSRRPTTAATSATTEISGVSEAPALKAAPGLRTSRSWRKSPTTSTGSRPVSSRTASCLVTTVDEQGDSGDRERRRVADPGRQGRPDGGGLGSRVRCAAGRRAGRRRSSGPGSSLAISDAPRAACSSGTGSLAGTPSAGSCRSGCRSSRTVRRCRRRCARARAGTAPACRGRC